MKAGKIEKEIRLVLTVTPEDIIRFFHYKSGLETFIKTWQMRIRKIPADNMESYEEMKRIAGRYLRVLKLQKNIEESRINFKITR